MIHRRRWLTALGFTVAAVLFAASAARAGILDASWTAPTTSVDGAPLTDLAFYHVYYGTSNPPCPGATSSVVTASTSAPAPGQTVTARLTGLVTGTLYYVAVTAVDTSGNESACSTATSAVARIDVTVTPAGTVDFANVAVGSSADQTFTVQNTGGGTITGTASTSAPFSVVSGGSFSLVGSGASQVVTVRFSPTVAATATSSVTFTTTTGGSLARTVTGTGLAGDTTAPTVTITSPTSGATYSTNTATLALGGTAADNVGVTQVSWTNSRGGSGTATGTTSWSAGGITLLAGANVLTVTARDAAGNTGTKTLTVTYDATAPVVSITIPTEIATYTTASTPLTLGGNASDNIAVTQVSWTNSRGGSGTATGTTLWTASGIGLQVGTNVLTVTARDAAGNTATDALTVTLTDTTPPTVAITAPAGGATVTGSVTLTATASDNVGVIGVQFRVDGVNVGAEDTTAPYSVSWNSATVGNGAHTVTAVARDAAGNTATATAVSVTVSNDVTAPVVSAVTASGMSTTSATITWTTDEASDSQVEYGLSAAYGSTVPLAAAMTTAHAQSLSGLASNTVYHYRVKSRDAAGNLATSGDFTFQTLASSTLGLVAYWTLDDGIGTAAADASGNNNTGTLVNAPVWTAGRIGTALAFDGATNYVNVPHMSTLNAYPLTVATWIKTSMTTGLGGIVNKYAFGATSGYQLFVNNGSLCAWYLRDATSFVSDGSACPLATAGYADNTWHHVVFVVDASGGRLYVDGAQKATLGWTGTSGATTTTQPIRLADYPGAPAGRYAGLVDDVRIYSRALTTSEITNFYASLISPTAPVISGVTASPSDWGATITWTTDKDSTTQVEYGLTTAYGSSTMLAPGLVTSHAQAVSGLAASTVYHFRVKSRDAAGNVTVSGDATFQTRAQAVRQKKSKSDWTDSVVKFVKRIF